MKKILVVLSLLFSLLNFSMAQPFTHEDTLRGSNGPGRIWWNATKYELHMNFNIPDSSIQGYNVISYQELNRNHADYFQIDLQEPLVIDSVVADYGSGMATITINSRIRKPSKRNLDFTRDGNAWFIYLKNKTRNDSQLPAANIKFQSRGLIHDTSYMKQNPSSTLTVYFHGKPKIARNAPWDGGMVHVEDNAGNPWVAVACQGTGASVWYPCKDYQGDEPDSAEMHFTAPSDLIIVSNGRLRDIKDNGDGKSTYTWAVVNPINNYDISPYIGKYVHWGEIYKGEKGNLTMDYWVLAPNLTKAKAQFKEATRMMKVFEYWFGPYPFYKDGYKLVEAPYLGMEHQSAIGYGNGFSNGYNGNDLSGTGWGMKWDFIIVHESGHEWFGNNITAMDIADMWIHEGFANYSETLFTEYYYGKKAATEYITGIRKNIRNDKPIIGYYGVNNEGSGDMYYKGGNMIHMIRQVINNDEKFRGILIGLNSRFYHQTVTTAEVEDYINQQSGINFSKVFDQYLRTIKIPVLEYKNVNGQLFYRWNNCVDGFKMPIKIYNINGDLIFIHPTQKFKQAPQEVKEMRVDENFYVNLREIKKD